MTDYVKRTLAQSQIVQLENQREELRLEPIPDLEAIRNLREAADKIRKQISEELSERPVFMPV